MKRHAIFAGALGLILAGADVAEANLIEPGDLIAVDRGNGTLDDVNPVTGASFVIASGFSNPQGVAINSSGAIFVSDIGTSTIDEVDPSNGMVTTFSGNGVGVGPALDRPFQMAFNASGTLIVADGEVPNGNSTAIFSVDPSGNRTLVAGNNGVSNNLFSESVAGLALNSAGGIFASAPTGGAVYTVAIGTAMSLTTAISAPQGLAFDTNNGGLLAVNGNPSSPAIWLIDPTNGNATMLSNNSGIGAGAAFNVLRGITVGPNGEIYATDVGDNEIYRIDPSTGNRVIVSGDGVGGTTFGGLTYGIAVYPDLASASPEPSSAMFLALGAVGLILYRTSSRNQASS